MCTKICAYLVMASWYNLCSDVRNDLARGERLWPTWETVGTLCPRMNRIIWPEGIPSCFVIWFSSFSIFIQPSQLIINSIFMVIFNQLTCHTDNYTFIYTLTNSLHEVNLVNCYNCYTCICNLCCISTGSKTIWIPYVPSRLNYFYDYWTIS